MAEPSEKKLNLESPPEWLIANIAEASKNSARIYLIYVSFLVYCALTIVSTADQQIVLNNSTVHLPLVSLDVPLIGFFIVAPLIAIFLFIYFQLYLNIIDRLKYNLRANYASIEEGRLYPWLLNFTENPKPSLTSTLQNLIIKITLWWSLPIVLTLFSFWLIKTHNIFLSYTLLILQALGTTVVLYFWFHHIKNNQISEPKKKPWWLFPKWWLFPNLTTGLDMAILAACAYAYVGVYVLAIIPRAQEDKYLIYADLSEQSLITIPKEDSQGLYWANLKGVHLEGANLIKAVVERANLRNAHLQYAVLIGTNLKKADLWETNLKGAFIGRANLQEAILVRANLQRAILTQSNLQRALLSEANLQGAFMEGANLQEAILEGANLQEADMQDAHLQGAIFTEANLHGAKHLTYEQLSTVSSLYGAILDEGLSKRLKANHPELFKPQGSQTEK